MALSPRIGWGLPTTRQQEPPIIAILSIMGITDLSIPCLLLIGAERAGDRHEIPKRAD